MNRSKTKVLIIDDEKVLLRMLLRIFTKSGFVVDVAGSAAEGIEKLQNSRYDLILTDIKMPGMSGIDFSDYVKKNVEQSIPIVAMSGTPWLLESPNFDAVVAKPFVIDDMVGKVRQLIQ